MLISSQRFLEPSTVADKRAGNDYIVSVTPELELDGRIVRVVVDGHHSYEAARLDGVAPVLREVSSSECDALSMLGTHDLEDVLEALQGSDDWYDLDTGEVVW